MLQELIQYTPNLIQSKYLKWYINLAKKIYLENRIYDSSKHELHHVLPKSFGGKNVLPYTFKEHYIAHLLLCKCTTGQEKEKMIYAMHTFFYFDQNRNLNINKSSYMYSLHKKSFMETCKIRMSNNNPRMDKSLYTFRHKEGKTFIGTRRDFLKNINDLSLHDMNALIRAYKAKIRWETKGWSIYIPDIKIFSSEIPRNVKPIRDKKYCNHCNNYIALGNFERWHGNNCKNKLICY